MAKQMSKKQIEEFVGRLHADKQSIVKQIIELGKDDPFSDPDHAIDNAAVDTDVREQIGHDTVEAEIKDLKTRLDDIERALARSEKGMYGVCEKCNGDIIVARLDLVPEARYCIDCERKLHE